MRKTAGFATEMMEDVMARPPGIFSRAAVWAILATFAVSALGHEYIFSAAVGRVQGYQTAFFMLHGLAVVATLQRRPQGRMRVPWIIATVGFLVATTVLFGLSVNEIIPLYDVRVANAVRVSS